MKGTQYFMAVEVDAQMYAFEVSERYNSENPIPVEDVRRVDMFDLVANLQINAQPRTEIDRRVVDDFRHVPRVARVHFFL